MGIVGRYIREGKKETKEDQPRRTSKARTSKAKLKHIEKQLEEEPNQESNEDDESYKEHQSHRYML